MLVKKTLWLYRVTSHEEKALKHFQTGGREFIVPAGTRNNYCFVSSFYNPCLSINITVASNKNDTGSVRQRCPGKTNL